MEFDELLITTGVDALVRLVKGKQRVELSAAAKALNIPETTLETWAGVLEEEGILEIEYKLTKVFLVWIPPTAKEVEEKEVAFTTRKEGLVQEAEALQKKFTPEFSEVENLQKNFNAMYEKLAAQLDKMEQSAGTAALPPARAPQLQQFQKELSGLKEGVAALRTEWKSFESSWKRMPPPSKAADTFALVQELDTLEKKVTSLKKGMPEEMPISQDLQRKVDELHREFKAIHEREGRLKENMRSLGEAGEIVQEMAGQLGRYESNIGKMKKEFAHLQGQIQALQEEGQRFSKDVGEQLEAMERFNDSLDVAKNILANYPSQSRVMQELEQLHAREKSIEEKMNAVEKLLAALKSPQKLVNDFTTLKSRIEKERRVLQEQAQQAAAAVEQQKTLYGSFEKIRDRMHTQIDEYAKQLAKLRPQLKSMESEAAEVAQKWEKQVKVLAKKSKEKDFRETLHAMQDLQGKKQLLDDIHVRLDALATTAESLRKRLSLLSREAHLLEIRTGKAMPAGEVPETEKSVREQLALTQKEEEEFRQKREELRKLIQKLWES